MKGKPIALLFFRENDHFISWLPNTIKTIPMSFFRQDGEKYWFETKNVFCRAAYKLGIIKHDCLYRLFYAVVFRRLQSAYARFVLFDAAYEQWQQRIPARFFQSLSEKNQIVVWQWNTVGHMLELSGFREATLRILDTVPREILYTFDPADAETYGMRFNTQFYVTPPEALLKPVPLLYDVVFCGTVKDRARAIEGIFKDCLEAGLKPHFTVCQNRSDSGMAADIEKAGSEVFSESNGWIPIYEWIDYTTDYIERLRAARAVFDCYHATQTGFSLRVMEHMFFSKKLITTNALVRQADFYNPANIFVYGEDDITTLKAWLDVPFEPVPEEIKDYYTVERWVERFDR